MKNDIKVVSKEFGESKGTVDELGMGEEGARKYCEKMNVEDRFASYEVVRRGA